MSSKLLRPHARSRAGCNAWINRSFDALSRRYRAHARAHRRPAAGCSARVMVAALVAERACCSSCVPTELAPAEDRGAFFRSSIEGPEGAGYDYTVAQMQQGREDRSAPQIGDGQADPARQPARARRLRRAARRCTPASAIVFLQDWDKRDVDDRRGRRASCSSELGDDARRARACRRSAAASCAAAASRSRSCSAGPDYAEIAHWRDRMLARMAAESRAASAPDSDYKETRPQMRVDIDRARAADLGVSVERHRPHAGDDDGLAPGDDLRRRTARNTTSCCRPTRRPRRARPTCAILRAFGRSGELVPLSNLVTLTRDRRARHAQPLQPAARDHAFRGPRARLHARRGDRLGAAGRRARNCPSTRRSTGRASRASSSTAGGAVLLTFAHGAADRLPGAGGAVRELHPSARDHADRAARRARRAARAVRSPAAR